MIKKRTSASEGFIYLVKFSNGIKFGRTKEIRVRLRCYKSPWCFPIEEVFEYKCRHPVFIEKGLRKRFDKNRRTGEFIRDSSFEELKGLVLELEQLSFAKYGFPK